MLRKRPDGFHDISTCFYPVPWTDIIEIVEGNRFEFTATGIAIPGDVTNNLCTRAYELLRKEFSLPPVKIHLHKMIPMGAGLGGGSSDGAFVLRLLNEKFNLKLSVHQLISYAAQLGSDCAFFIQDLPMLGEGRGEKLNSISVSLKGKYLAVVKPDVHVSTAEAYAGVLPGVPPLDVKEILEQRPIQEWKDLLINDFEKSISARHPVILEIKEALYQQGAVYASMSGSGSAVFGVFDREVVLPNALKTHVWWQGKITV